jgi:hypothetical protein
MPFEKRCKGSTFIILITHYLFAVYSCVSIMSMLNKFLYLQQLDLRNQKHKFFNANIG